MSIRTAAIFIGTIVAVCFVIIVIANGCRPRKPKNVNALHIDGRDFAVSGNGYVGNDLSVGFAVDTSVIHTNQLKMRPIERKEETVSLDDDHSCVILTNDGANPVCVNLPNKIENGGLWLILINRTRAGKMLIRESDNLSYESEKSALVMICNGNGWTIV